MSGFPQNNGFDPQGNGFDQNNAFDQNQNGGYDQNAAPNGNGSMENITPGGTAQATTSDSARTLWMGDLDTWMDETFIKTSFASATGEQVSVKIIRDRQSG